MFFLKGFIALINKKKHFHQRSENQFQYNTEGRIQEQAMDAATGGQPVLVLKKKQNIVDVLMTSLCFETS